MTPQSLYLLQEYKTQIMFQEIIYPTVNINILFTFRIYIIFNHDLILLNQKISSHDVNLGLLNRVLQAIFTYYIIKSDY